MAGPEPTVSSPRLTNRALPWIVFLIGVGLSVAVSFSARREVKQQDEARFTRLKERLLGTIDARFQAAEQAIYGGRALVETTGEISHPQWARYVDSVWPFFDRGVV